MMCNSYDFADLNLSTFTIPAGTVIKNSVLSITASSNTASPGQGEAYLLTQSGTQLAGPATAPSTSTANIVTGTVTYTAALDQTTLDGLKAYCTANVANSGTSRIMEISLLVTYANAPGTPTWSAPAATITTTRSPTHTWTHVAGTDGGAQTKFRVRVFTVAQTGIGGFDPATSPATLDSGVITSSTSSWVPTSPLSNGVTYRSYVTTYATTNGVDQQSPWSAVREFIIQITPPVPTALVPAAAAVATTSRPAVGADVAAMTDGITVQREWTIASNTIFTTSVTTIIEPTLSLTKSGTYAFPALPSRLAQGTWYIRCRVIDQYGVVGAWAAYNTFTVAHAPTASSSRLPGSGQAVAYAGTRQVTWVFADPDTEDYQTKYEAELWKQSAPGSPIVSGLITSGVGAHTFTIPDVTWKAVDLRWRVRTTDRDNVVGAWSPDSSFFMYDLPVPTITFPAEAQVITTAQPTFTWTFSATNGRTQASFRVVVTKVSDSSVIADSGVVAGTALSWQIPTPSILVSTNYSVALTLVDSAGLSATDNNAFTATYSAPTTPVFSVTGAQFEDLGRVFVDWSTATTDATNLGWKVYRRITGEPGWTFVAETVSAVKTYYDYLCPSATNVQYSVVQVAESFGAPVESAYPSVDFYGEAKYFLVCPDDDSLNLKLHSVTADDFEDEQEMATQNLIGRGRRVEYGTRYGQTGSLTADFRDREEVGGMTAREQRLALEALRSSGLKVYLRNPFGDVWAVALQSARLTRQAGVGMQEITSVSISYTEITG
jgi:hypothetical protein